MAVEDVTQDGMNAEERLTWLRERGVQVETPEERRAAAIKSAMREADAMKSASLSTEPNSKISYVWIPADASQALQELSFTPKQDDVDIAGDALAKHLKVAFSGSSDKIDIGLLQKNQETPYQLLGTGGSTGEEANDLNNLMSNVSEDKLKEVAKQGNVETFTLVHAIPSNNFLGVNLYLDEVGMLKRLPLNHRASAYAKQAGFNPPPQFFGDVFLGRVHKRNAAVIRNFSLRLGPDTAMDAEWLQRASMENLEYQMEMNRMTGRKDIQPPPVAGDGVAQTEEGYVWTQTETELELVFLLPSADAKSKDIQVKFHSQSIKVSYQGQSLVSLELFERVDIDGCTWTIERKDGHSKLVVTMEKTETAFWPRIRD